MSDEEVLLPGGDVTLGVARAGGTVRRPVGAHSHLVHLVLRHLEIEGFAGAPRYLGLDPQGREILTYIEGEVAGRPSPPWMAEDERAVSVARLVRAFDDSMVSFGIPDDLPTAAVTSPEPAGAEPLAEQPTFIGHRDITPENVVFRDGAAVALIDFDLARPSTRCEEVANMLTWWAPWQPVDDRPVVLRDVDESRRARLMVDAYGLGLERDQLVEVSIQGAKVTWHTMKWRAENLGGGWARLWNEEDAGGSIKRREAWLHEHRQRLEAAVVEGFRLDGVS